MGDVIQFKKRNANVVPTPNLNCRCEVWDGAVESKGIKYEPSSKDGVLVFNEIAGREAHLMVMDDYVVGEIVPGTVGDTVVQALFGRITVEQARDQGVDMRITNWFMCLGEKRMAECYCPCCDGVRKANQFPYKGT